MFKARWMMASLLMAGCMSFADTPTTGGTSGPPTVPPNGLQRYYDNTYVYVKYPVRLSEFFLGLQKHDPSLQASIDSTMSFISTQIAKTIAPDEAALNQDANSSQSTITTTTITNDTKQLSTDLNWVITEAAQLYGTVSSTAESWGPWTEDVGDPSALVIFGAAEYDANVFNIPWLKGAAVLQNGGSFTVAIVLVPMRIWKKRLDGTGDWQESWELFSDPDAANLVVIPNWNFGAAIQAGQTLTSTNSRYGVGFVWGNLNTAQDLTGVTLGTSWTVDAPGLLKLEQAGGTLAGLPTFVQNILKADGVNIKLMGVVGGDGISNVIGMVGLDKGAAPAATEKTSKFFTLDAEAHFDLSYIWDFYGFFSGVYNGTKAAINKVTGTGSTDK